MSEATIHGLKQDETIREKVKEQCEEDVAKLKAKFHKLVHELTGEYDYYPNPDSWQQMQELYFDKLGLKGDGRSTDEANRIYMMKQSSTSPLAKEMLTVMGQYKEENKFLGTYANARTSNDGRMRCDHKQYGVASAPGRISTSQLIDGTGQNLQNQPMRARSVFITDDTDHVFVYADGEQAEARVVAYRARIPKWKDQFERARLTGDYDCHRALASEMFKVPYDQVPKNDWDDDNKPTIRYTSKRCRHGLNYRMERYKLAEVTGLPFWEASKAFVLYHAITPELRQWWEEEEKSFRKYREAFNAFGRRHKVVQRIDDEALKSIVAFYPQSTVGDWITRAWYMTEEDDDFPPMEKARVCLDVHDNLVIMCHKSVAMKCARILKKHLEAPIMIQSVYRDKAEPLIIPSEIKMSYPTVVKFDKKGRILPGDKGFVEDPKGLHRWSHLKKVKLDDTGKLRRAA